MIEPADGFEFVWLPLFEQTAKKLLGDEDRRALEQVTPAEEKGLRNLAAAIKSEDC